MNVSRRISVIAVVVLTVLSASVMAAFTPANYNRRGALMAGAELYWRVAGVEPNAVIHFAVAAPTTAGWIGFGIGEFNSGSMPGSDMMIATVDAQGALALGDYHALGYYKPLADCHNATSDWVPVGATRNATHTVVEFYRKAAVVNTDEDRAIVNDANPTKVVFAYGTSSTIEYHGTQRAMAAFRFFDTTDELAALKADPSVKVARWGMVNYNIPARTTTYAYTGCFRAPGTVLAQIVGFNVQVSPASNKPFIHHLVVRAFSATDCTGLPVDLLGVASAHVPFILPPDIGLPLQYGSYNVEIHFDNPTLVSGLVDNSGVDVYYTEVPREHAAGVIVLGDPLVATRTTLAPGQYTAIDYACPGRCSETGWSSDITVFAELLHMHQTGAYMQTRFGSLRSSPASTTEWFTFHTQQNVLTPRRFVVPRGTDMTTRCVYKVDAGASAVQFGLGSTQEMCMHFVFYYPVQSGFLGSRCGLGLCGSQIGTTTSAVDNVTRSFNGSCGVQADLPPEAPRALSAASEADSFRVAASLVLAVVVALAVIGF